MRFTVSLAVMLGIFLMPKLSQAQERIEEVGAWYMYFFNAKIKESQWGVQGDVQFRNWDYGSDLEQLLLRGGVTYTPKNTDLLLTVGYGNITTGAYGDSDETTSESRIYQEALFPSQFGNRIFLKHRFRYEQRFVEDQDFRTRFRYNLFINVPLTSQNFDPKTIYLALYNELFVNGERSIGEGRSVELFDRNRFYAGFGFVISKHLKTQLGYMKQTTDNWDKEQLQISLHHKF